MTNPDGDKQEVGEEDEDLSSPSPDLDHDLLYCSPLSAASSRPRRWWRWLLLEVVLVQA